MPKDHVKDRLNQIRRENEEQLARTENTQPTPTQEENDRAALGIESLEQLDDKEPDGSEEQPEGTGSPLPNPLARRSAEAGERAQEAARSSTSKKNG